MPIITISRGSYFYGKSIAEKLAQRLNYACVSRDEIIENLEEFHLPEIKLIKELKDAYSVLDRFPHGKKRFVAAIRSAILNRFLASNVVYHGLVGHYFVSSISYVLKVRIISDIGSRVAGEMTRENISEKKARYILKKTMKRGANGPCFYTASISPIPKHTTWSSELAIYPRMMRWTSSPAQSVFLLFKKRSNIGPPWRIWPLPPQSFGRCSFSLC